jgi:hypothetical protein
MELSLECRHPKNEKPYIHRTTDQAGHMHGFNHQTYVFLPAFVTAYKTLLGLAFAPKSQKLNQRFQKPYVLLPKSSL